MKNRIGIAVNDTERIVKAIDQLIAEYHVYYQNLRIFHWHVTGPHFFTLHGYFETLYNDACVNIDALAERVLMLGWKPEGHWSVYLDRARIREAGKDQEAAAMVGTVLDDHQVLVAVIRDAISEAQQARDEGTADLLTGMLRGLEKSNWMLQSWKRGVEIMSFAS